MDQHQLQAHTLGSAVLVFRQAAGDADARPGVAALSLLG